MEVVQAVLTGKFEDSLGNTLDVPDRIDFDPYPCQSFANWILSQLVRWDILGDGKARELTANGQFSQLGQEIFLTDLARELAEELGQTPPQEIYRTETLAFDTFDPQQPDQYIQAQIERYGF